MVLDVLFYGDTDNPNGIDSSWPAKVREIADDGAPDPDPPWVRMTVDEYKSYRSGNAHKVAEITERKQLVANTADGPIGHGLTVVRIHSRISPN